MNRFLALLVLLTFNVFVACSDDSELPPKRSASDMDVQSPDTGDTTDMAQDDGVLSDGPPPAPGQLTISDTLVSFDRVRQGESETQTVAISNVGGQELLITRVRLRQLNRSSDLEFKPGENWIDEATFIEGGTFLELDIVYEPEDFETDQGTLTIETSDPENPVFDVRIETLSAYRDIDAPRFVRFGFVETQTAETQQVFVYNRGGEPLTLEDIEYDGLGEFSINFDANTNHPNFPDTNAILEPGEAFAIDVLYTPQTTDPDRGTITVTSNDPDEPTVAIALAGNESGECIRVTPRVVDFGELAPGASDTQQVTLFNCSNLVELPISDVVLEDDGGGVFQLDSVPEIPFTIDPFEFETIDVIASLEEGNRLGEVLITTGNGDSRTLDLRAAAQPD